MTLSRTLRISAALVVSALALPSVAIAATSTSSGQVVIKSGEHLRGRRTAPVTMVLYADYECPFCQQLHPVITQILRKYRNKVSLIYRHYPLPFHENAVSAAEASECVGYLGGPSAFWGFTDSIFAIRNFNTTNYYTIGQKLGIDLEKLSICIDKRVFKAKVETQKNSGDLAGVQGTPTVFIVSRQGRYQKTVAGAQDTATYTTIIDKMLAEVEAGNPGGFKQP